MGKELLFIFFLGSIFFANGQQADVQKDSIGSMENIHLHLNKTTFLQGERLWFKAYVRNQRSKLPSFFTSNLHVGIFDGTGKELKRKLFYVENGMAQGDFAIDSSLTGTAYTVLAWTNYMRNFKELHPYRQNIRVLRNDAEEEDLQTGAIKISIYPEGGQLITGAYNQVGLLVSNGLGQGISVKNLELVDGNGQIVRKKVATNRFGMGKIGFHVEPGHVYYVQMTGFDGNLIREKLPEAVNNEFGISVDNKDVDKVLMVMVGSKSLFTIEDGKAYTLAVYQDDFIGLEDFEVNGDEPKIWFDRNQMPHGVLTAVLFNNSLEPIARRMFFNHREAVFGGKVEIEHCQTAFRDSIQVDLMLPNGVEQSANLSLSALPGSSRAYTPDHSIISSFLVHPYVNESIQDRYYFEVQDRQRRFELDKRLLIEGWGKYDWNSRKLEEVKVDFELEKGIPFSGRITDARLGIERQLVLYTGLSKTMDYVDLRSDASFGHSMPLFEGDSISFSLLGARGNLRKPEATVKIGKSLEEAGEGVNTWLAKETLENETKGVEEVTFDQTLNLDERTIALSEVTVSDKKEENKIIDFSPTTLGRFIGDEEIERHRSLVNFLAGLGFGISSDGGSFNLAIMKYGGLRPVPLYVEGSFANANEIMGMALKDVKYVTYSKTPPDAFVSIALNQNYISPEKRDKFIKFAIEKGYAQPQAYFAANYPDYASAVFRNYGTLDWKANINVDSEVPTSFTIPVLGQNRVILHIEGMGVDGTLTSLSKRIELTEE